MEKKVEEWKPPRKPKMGNNATRTTLKWTKHIDPETLFESFGWYSHETKDSNKMSFEDFTKRVIWHSSYEQVSLEQLLTMPNVQGLPRHRLQAQTPHEAYPVSDRPRGQEGDIDRIVSLQASDSVSPVVLLSSGRTWLFLDGTHRLLAAKFLANGDGSAALIRVLWIF